MQFAGIPGTSLDVSRIALGTWAIHRQEAADSEVLLEQAGFQARAADSPERQQDLVKMPSRQIVERDQNGAAVYTFADPDKLPLPLRRRAEGIRKAAGAQATAHRR